VENKERWLELCAQAAKEQDPERLFKLFALASSIHSPVNWNNGQHYLRGVRSVVKYASRLVSFH